MAEEIWLSYPALRVESWCSQMSPIRHSTLQIDEYRCQILLKETAPVTVATCKQMMSYFTACQNLQWMIQRVRNAKA